MKRGKYVKRETLQAKLDRRSITAPSGCRIWLGYVQPSGYGQVRVDDRVMGTHRAAYELAFGPIPDGLHIDHLCRRPRCIKPMHLQAVTPLVNCRRGYSLPAMRGRSPICLYGHSDWETSATGFRLCTTCNRARARAAYWTNTLGYEVSVQDIFAAGSRKRKAMRAYLLGLSIDRAQPALYRAS